MKGSTVGARHLAESRNWLEWNREFRLLEVGTLMQTAMMHWDVWQRAAFLAWSRQLPC